MRQRGFTILEVIIALTMTSILATMIYATFVGQTRSYEAQNMLARADASMRQAIAYVGRDLANIGHGMNSFGQSLGADGIGGNSAMPLAFLNLYNGGPGVPDAFTIAYMDPDPRGQFMVNFGDGMSTQPAPCNTNLLQVRDIPEQLDAAGPNNLEPGDTLICYTPSGRNYSTDGGGGAASFSFTVLAPAGASGDLSVGGQAVGAPDNFNSVCTGSLPTMICGKMIRHSYYVDDNEADGIGPGTAKYPALMMSTDPYVPGAQSFGDIPIALGIEDIQLDACWWVGDVGYDCDLAGWSAISDGSWISVPISEVGQFSLRVAARSDKLDQDGMKKYNRLNLDGRAGAIGTPVGAPDDHFRRFGSVQVQPRNAQGSFLVQAMSSGTASASSSGGP